MLESIIYFERSKATEVLSLILGLPFPLTPISFTENDENQEDRFSIIDSENIQAILDQPSQKYYLNAELCRYHLFLKQDYSALCIDKFNESVSFGADALMARIASLVPFFRFICESKERAHRNRIYKTIGSNKIEAWLGRNPYRKIPGLYWKTIFSKHILLNFNINIDYFENLSKKISILEKETFLVTFFDRAKDWNMYAETLDIVCNSYDGIFSKEDVLSETSQIDNMIQYMTAISKWK